MTQPVEMTQSSGTAAAHRVAAVQLISGPDVQRNLEEARRLIGEAAAQGAELVVLPEYFPIMGLKDTDKVAVAEPAGAGPIQAFLREMAQQHKIWVIGGTLPLQCQAPGKVRNTTLVYTPEGQVAARYDKIHLFGLDLGREVFRESDTIEAGRDVVTVDTPLGRIGLSVCYDLRFPELYRAMGPVDIIVVPSAFTETTGRAHWEILLRARAIENQAYVIAPGQGGVHPSQRETHGHSMIIDPWGTVLGQVEKGPGVVVAEIRPERLAHVRRSLPALAHRTL